MNDKPQTQHEPSIEAALKTATQIMLIITDSMILCTCAAHEKLTSLDTVSNTVRKAAKSWFAKHTYDCLYANNSPEKLYRELVLFVRETTEAELNKLKTEK